MNLEELLETYGDQLYRIGLLLLKNREDTEDAVQETLYKYMNTCGNIPNSTTGNTREDG